MNFFLACTMFRPLLGLVSTVHLANWLIVTFPNVFSYIALSGIHEGTGAELKYSSNFQIDPQTIKTMV